MNATLTVLPALLAIAGPIGSAAHSPAAREARGGAAMPAAVITFRPSAEVGGRVIRLSDVAAVEAPDARLVARLEAVDVGSAPLHGHSRSVSAAYAQIRIRQIGVDVNRLQFH